LKYPKHGFGLLLAAVVCLGSGCVSNQIGLCFVSFEQSANPRVGLNWFHMVYKTEKHYRQRSIAGMIEGRVRGLMGDDSIARAHEQGVKRRQEMLQVLQGRLTSCDLFSYVRLRTSNKKTTVMWCKQDIAQYAQDHNIDMVMIAFIYLDFGEVSWIGRLGDSYLSQRLTLRFFNSEVKQIGSIKAKSKSEPFHLDPGLYDARDPQFGNRYRSLTRNVSLACLDALRHKIDLAKSVTKE